MDKSLHSGVQFYLVLPLTVGGSPSAEGLWPSDDIETIIGIFQRRELMPCRYWNFYPLSDVWLRYSHSDTCLAAMPINRNNRPSLQNWAVIPAMLIGRPSTGSTFFYLKNITMYITIQVSYLGNASNYISIELNCEIAFKLSVYIPKP